MKAVAFHAAGDFRLDDVPAPQIKEPADAIVRLASSAICGADLCVVRAVDRAVSLAGGRRLHDSGRRAGSGRTFFRFAPAIA
jgi:hypothetical protein